MNYDKKKIAELMRYYPKLSDELFEDLYNAFERIEQLEAENAALKDTVEGLQK